jgi:hypothetical protein
MANRVLRDWTTSENVDAISFEAEVFFARLIMKADDYGSYYANPKLLKSALFPLREVTYGQIGKWVFECTEAGLIFPYEVEGKEYIRIKNFKQRLRQMRNVFPHPVEKADHLPQVADKSPSIDSESPPERETEVETKQETETESESARVVFVEENVPRELKIDLPDKTKIAEEIFNDELFVEDLRRNHPKKNIPRAWEECWLYHSVKPSPPMLAWQWRQKLSTWLINTKDGTSKKTDAVNSRREAFAKRNSTNPGG